MEVIFFSVVFGGFAVMLFMKKSTNLEFSNCDDSDCRND